MVNVTSPLAKAGSGVGFSFGVKAWTEMEIRCVKGMYRLKLISSENNSGFKGLKFTVVREVLCNNYRSHNLIGPYNFWGISQRNLTLFTRPGDMLAGHQNMP